MKTAAEILNMSRAELARLVACQQLTLVLLENDLRGMRDEKVDPSLAPAAREIKRAIYVTFRDGINASGD